MDHFVGISLRLGAKTGLDGLAWAIWKGQSHLNISWVSETARTSWMNIEGCDNAYTLYYKSKALAEEGFSAALGDMLRKLGADTSDETSKPDDVLPLEEGELPEFALPSWSADEADRFIRAKAFPPHGCAAGRIDGDPPKTFHLENLDQFERMCKQSKGQDEDDADEDDSYAKDTHFYSNVGGRCVKVTNGGHCNDLREVSKAVDLVPGVARGAAKRKMRMNEPLIGFNAAQYCTEALESGWLGVEGPFIKKFERKLAQICGLGS